MKGKKYTPLKRVHDDSKCNCSHNITILVHVKNSSEFNKITVTLDFVEAREFSFSKHHGDSLELTVNPNMCLEVSTTAFQLQLDAFSHNITVSQGNHNLKSCHKIVIFAKVIHRDFLKVRVNPNI